MRRILLVALGAFLLGPLAVALLALAPWSDRAEYGRDVRAALATPPARETLVTEADLAPLPPPLGRYLRFAGVVGRPRVRSYRVRFQGLLRSSLDGPWMRVRVTQHSFVAPAARFFLVEASRNGIPFTAYHRYVGAHATFRVRVASLVQVVDAKGPEMDRGETVTLFDDLCLLAPAALLDADVRWETLDSTHVRGTFTNAGHTVVAVLTIGPDGALRDFASADRSLTSDGRTYRRLPWSTPVRAWGNYGGVRLARSGDALWQTPDGPVPYARFELLSAEYNVGAR